MLRMLMNFKDLEGVQWADYFLKEDTKKSVFVQEDTFDDDGWEQAGVKPKKVEKVVPPRWCRDGNACQWSNCKFRHERCSHYDNWVKRGNRGINCRHHATDPLGNKSQRDGGCMYDHRDVKNLRMFVETVPVNTERELWNNFFEKGLELYISDVFDPRGLAYLDRCLLIRSLTAAGIDHEDHGNHIIICYED